MTNGARYKRQILALGSDELESFAREWVGYKNSVYEEVTSFGGAGDLGRDVVGFLSKSKHEGPWHNYQCKQYSTTLPTGKSLLELGKILYYAHLGEFSAPEKYNFVAPKGANRNLERLIYNPSKLKSTLINEWDKYCGVDNIIANEHVELTAELKGYLESYDYSKVSIINLDSILLDQHIQPVLFNWFGADPGPAPRGVAPDSITERELTYISQLVNAYADRDKCTYNSVGCLKDKQKHLRHLSRQRERFFDADAFKRFYRDNTDSEVIADFEDDIFHGVIDISEKEHADALDCVESVMTVAGTISASGLLENHARVTVKQGICHHLANEDKLEWKN